MTGSDGSGQNALYGKRRRRGNGARGQNAPPLARLTVTSPFDSNSDAIESLFAFARLAAWGVSHRLEQWLLETAVPSRSGAVASAWRSRTGDAPARAAPPLVIEA